MRKVLIVLIFVRNAIFPPDGLASNRECLRMHFFKSFQDVRRHLLHTIVIARNIANSDSKLAMHFMQLSTSGGITHSWEEHEDGRYSEPIIRGQ